MAARAKIEWKFRATITGIWIIAYELKTEWECAATVTGTVYAATEEGARSAASTLLESGTVCVFADIEDVSPCNPDELEEEDEDV